MKQLIRVCAIIALMSALMIDAEPCKTGGTPKAPTPSPKNQTPATTPRASTPVKK